MRWLLGLSLCTCILSAGCLGVLLNIRNTMSHTIVTRAPLTAHWVDQDGLEQTFETPALPDETLDDHQARHRENCLIAMKYFPVQKERLR